ncbi:MAG: hypothetical protein HY291_11340 [Planctomycetes bacterium]|nr:hypothetical protein [Planctomycetota bacterium]
MSAHGQDSHGHDAGHGGDHGHGGHGDVHDEHWGDYNNKPPDPSTLPKVPVEALAVFGLALAGMMAAITLYSMKLSTSAKPDHAAHEESGKHEK